MIVVRLAAVCGEEPCVTTRCLRFYQFSFENVFLFSPLFLNNSESRVNVAYPEQSHSTIRHKIDSTVNQNFKIGAAIEA